MPKCDRIIDVCLMLLIVEDWSKVFICWSLITFGRNWWCLILILIFSIFLLYHLKSQEHKFVSDNCALQCFKVCLMYVFCVVYGFLGNQSCWILLAILNKHFSFYNLLFLNIINNPIYLYTPFCDMQIFSSTPILHPSAQKSNGSSIP